MPMTVCGVSDSTSHSVAMSSLAAGVHPTAQPIPPTNRHPTGL